MKTRIAVSVLVLSSFVSSPGVASGSETMSPGVVAAAAVVAVPHREATSSGSTGSRLARAEPSAQSAGEPVGTHRYLLSEIIGNIAVYADSVTGLDDASWAIGRFELAGIPLPTAEVFMSTDRSECRGSAAYLTDPADGPLRIRSCATRFTLLHELGHAWDMGYLTDVRRDSFMGLRGLDSWKNQEDPRAAAGEHAATAMAWGLNDQRINQWDLQPSDPDSMHQAFVLLAGQRPLWEPRLLTLHTPLDAFELRTIEKQAAPTDLEPAPVVEPAANSGRDQTAERLVLEADVVQALVKRDLRAVADGRGRVGFLLPEAAFAFREMRNAAAQDDVVLRFTSAWRSWSAQDRAYQHFIETGTNLAGNPVPNIAHPDSSNHPRGLALDFALDEGTSAWLGERAADHGWYPIPSEAWHWEYRGQDEYRHELTALPPAPIPLEDSEPTEPRTLAGGHGNQPRTLRATSSRRLLEATTFE